mmetsp:Transcript_120741/g.342083  ORF Transcript_120741/g.342083 Transcript_120741/m.342083 type:complete len:216 (-) Transcript_120741:1272-1919(-)
MRTSRRGSRSSGPRGTRRSRRGSGSTWTWRRPPPTSTPGTTRPRHRRWPPSKSCSCAGSWLTRATPIGRRSRSQPTTSGGTSATRAPRPPPATTGCGRSSRRPGGTSPAPSRTRSDRRSSGRRHACPRRSPPCAARPARRRSSAGSRWRRCSLSLPPASGAAPKLPRHTPTMSGRSATPRGVPRSWNSRTDCALSTRKASVARTATPTRSTTWCW